MNENPLENNIGPSPEEQKRLEEKEELERYEFYMQTHPEVPFSPYTEAKEPGPESAEFENLVKQFEQEHSLEALHAITDLTPEEAKTHPIFWPAKLALAPIYEAAKVFRHNEELWGMYNKLARAVGVIDKDNKVDHTR
ncbi:hypothetical protein A3J61_01255 [Candidatus Nomurabacteria bacterium RIFCSPHIGHO2_02_FULL_38_15]|uniref:Uncharacterized protein n=1 Tax=Candidatus Nomurabacteria bacterium RIFCSPHIGHO2_02_FULL_38_15 TaxID=1801752 RepID=A0A1F6VSC7_9BACT|nr:MAG: hypothetical protein A3J61_01255 [Candidatus Nomurabacteria bacterium RIFCSPHIGHO2_02_FULL_38_15]